MTCAGVNTHVSEVLARELPSPRVGPGSVVFCRSGGGMPGLDIHVGLWLALEAAGIRSTWCVGTSAGAMISALDAAGWTATMARDLVCSLTDRDVRRERFAWKLRPWLPHFLDPAPIRNLVEGTLPARFADLDKPLTVHCTSDEFGGAYPVSYGPLAPAVMASMAISGVWPAVEVDQGSGAVMLSDGGTTANLPIPSGLAVVDEVWLLVAARPLSYPRGGWLSRIWRNLDILAEDQIDDTIALVEGQHRRVRVLRPPFVPKHGCLHFEHGLVNQVRDWAAGEIERVRGDTCR